MNDITMYSPRNLDELVPALAAETGLSKIIAGGTDLTIAMHEGEVCPDILIDVSRTEEMRRISESGGKIVIGAAVTFTEAENDPTIKKYFPSIARAASGVGSKQIRNRGTIGGNLANASPAGDMLPPLTALDARVVTVNSKNEIKRRTVNDIVAPGSPQKLKFDEAVVSIELPAPRGESVNIFAKLGSRRAVSIARLSVALNAGFSGGLLTAPIVILGALGRAPVDAKRAAAAIEDVPLTDETAERFAEAMAEEVDLAIPGRYSQPYKREAIKGLALDLLSQLPR